MNRIIYNVEYNIPRANITLPGRQNRAGDGVLRITPGVDEPLEFVFGNQDGVPLNLVPFKIKMIFWVMEDLDYEEMVPGQSEIVLAHEINTIEPYAGRAFTILSADDTLKLASESTSFIRWSLYMLNEDEQVFPIEVNRNGGRYGTLRMDFGSGMPIAEVVKSA